MVDRRLSFAQQTKRVCLQAKRAIGALVRRFRGATPMYVLERVYQSVILPQVLYAIECWFPSALKWRTKLERVQNFFLKQYQNNYVRTYSELLTVYKVTTGKELSPLWLTAARKGMDLFYKFYHKMRYCPETTIQMTTTRKSARLNHGNSVGITARTVTTASTFFPTCSQIWNKLPNHVPELGLNGFKFFTRRRSDEFTLLLKILSSQYHLSHIKFCCPTMFLNYS